MNPDRLGTAQWADSKEVAARLPFRDGSLWLGRTMPDQVPVGIDDDRHALLVAGTRSGKGTSVLIPNLLCWKGSVVVIDPTGDIASLTSARRGKGQPSAGGMGQAVHVLDPYGISKVAEEYRACFNPLDMLDATSKHVVREAEGIAASLVPPSKEEEPWAQNGARRLLAGLILYVVSDPVFKDRRNLVTVRDLVHRGDTAELAQQQRLGGTSGLTAFDLLWLGMRLSNACGGQIAGTGEEFTRVSKFAPTQWSGVHDVALSATNFINNEDMRRSLSSSTFSIRDLKTSANGTSLYLTVPSKTKVEDFRWLRLVISLILSEMESIVAPPATGHATLFMLDEFAGLQKMDRIESGIAEIAKYGVKLLLVLQSLPQLKSVYGDNWETFIANCGTKIFFGIEDNFTRDYVSRLIGETELRLLTAAQTKGTSTNQTVTSSTGRSQSHQTSEGLSQSDSYKRAMFGLRDTASIFRKLAGSAQASDSRESSTSAGRSTEESRAEGQTSGEESSSTQTEQIHKRPLVTPDEVGKRFRRIDRAEKSSLYPGMAIGLLASLPDPVLFRRTNYFDDTFFAVHGFGPPGPLPPTPAPPRPLAPYIGKKIDLPFSSLGVTLLHDEFTAVVGGVDGQIAAVDLRSGDVIHQTVAEPEMGQSHRPGGGEIKYIADRFLFLRRAPLAQSFFTMSHSGVLKTWVLDGGLHLHGSVELLAPHRRLLRERIEKASRGRGWSHWTMYSGEIPPEVPNGIVSAKTSPDGSSLICLTEWFAVYRCDIAGRLKDGPVVIGDAFAIEPANADGSEVWVGRESMSKALYRVNLRSGSIQNVDFSGHPDFTSQGIFAISPGALCAGGVTLALPSLVPIESAQMSRYSKVPPLVLGSGQRIAAISASIISFYDSKTFKKDGENLLGGDDIGELRGLDATNNGAYLVSLAERSLHVWDTVARAPVGGFPEEQVVLRHGLHNHSDPVFSASSGEVFYRAYADQAAVLINTRTRKFTKVSNPLQWIVGVAASGPDFHLVSFGTREGPAIPGAKGLLGRLLKVPPPVQHLLLHYTVSLGKVVERATVVLEGERLNRCEPDSRNSRAIDVGHGRMALLTAGHLAIYDVKSKAIVCGPIDISGPAGADPGPDSSWTYYTQLVVSADMTKLIVRARGRPIKVFSAVNLALLTEIHESEGDLGLLIPWTGSRHVLFEKKVGADRYSSDTVLAIADCSTGMVLGKLCKVRGYAGERPYAAALLRHGSVLALIESKSIVALDLCTGMYLDKPIGTHADSIDSVHLCPEGDALLSTSQDGTAKFWDYAESIEDSPARAAQIPALARRF